MYSKSKGMVTIIQMHTFANNLKFLDFIISVDIFACICTYSSWGKNHLLWVWKLILNIKNHSIHTYMPIYSLSLAPERIISVIRFEINFILPWISGVHYLSQKCYLKVTNPVTYLFLVGLMLIWSPCTISLSGKGTIENMMQRSNSVLYSKNYPGRAGEY